MSSDKPDYELTFRVYETHDGVECKCINELVPIRIGDTINLLHTCHDGRVDKVEAKLLSTKEIET